MESLYTKYPSHFHFVAFIAVAVFTTSFLLNQISIDSESQYAAAGVAEISNAHSVAGFKDPDKFVVGQIIVQFKAGVPQVAHDKTLGNLGLTVKSTIKDIGAEVVSVPAGAEKKVRDALAHNPQVQYAELDGLADASLIPNDPYWYKMWPLQDTAGGIHAPAAWDTTNGSGQTIAILDSGQDGTHPDLAANMVPGYNFLANNSNTGPDSCAHGTAVAGAAAAVGNNATGTVGTAWGAKIMPLVIADYAHTQCAGSWSAIASAETYAADHGVRIINISYGGDAQSSTEQNAANYAWSKGAIIFAAAGNSGGGTNPVQYPAADQNVVAVAGTDPTGAYASFSEYGNFIDIAAPGGFYSTDQVGTAGYSTGDYISISGTSFSSPIAAGVAALVLAKNPTLTNSQVVSLMEQNADDEGTAGWDVHYGWGKINAARTIIAAGGSTSTTDATPPTGSISVLAKNPIYNASYASGATTIMVTASDNVGVGKVELYKDGALYATINVGPYNYYWDASTEVNGSQHTFYAKLYDYSGNVGTTATVTVTVDNTIPTVSVTSPTSGATVSGTVSLIAAASDPTSATSVFWQVDGANMNGSQWDTTGTTNGTHIVTALAYDRASNLATSSITVSVNNAGGTTDTQAPSTNVGTPANGATVSGAVNVLASAGDNVGVVRFELYKDGALVNSITGSTMSYTWDTTQDTNGTHTLQTKAYDAAGNVGTSPINSVNVSNRVADTQAPATSITSPTSGSIISGTSAVTASASDNVGVTRVEFYKDSLLASTVSVAPYIWSWDTAADTNATHTLTTKAYDAAGNVGASQAVNITVSNLVNNVPDTTPPTVTITSPANGTKLKGMNTKVSVSASDTSGIAIILISIDGVSVKTCNAVTSCSYTWQLKSAAPGSHVISAIVTDASSNNNQGTASITVTK